MTQLVRVRVWSHKDWSSIQVPSGAELVWAVPVLFGGPPMPTDPPSFDTYWRVPDWWLIGNMTVLIRKGDFPSPSFEGPDRPSLSGIAGASSFINQNIFFWTCKEGFVASDYPTNASLASNPK